MRAVKAYFVLDAEQSIAAAIFAEGLDAENCLPTEYRGYASAPAATAAAAAAVWSEGWSPDEKLRRTEVEWRGNYGRRMRAHSRALESLDLNAVA